MEDMRGAGEEWEEGWDLDNEFEADLKTWRHMDLVIWVREN